MKKQTASDLMSGMFVRHDMHGNKCCVGDTVKVTRPELFWCPTDDDEPVLCPEQTWIGEIRLLLSCGIVIKTVHGYVKPPLTDKSFAKWTWELMKPKSWTWDETKLIRPKK